MLVTYFAALVPTDMPLWVAIAVWAALLYTAIVDARTGLVPPVPLALAGLVVMTCLIVDQSSRATAAPLAALLFYIGIFLINEIHYSLTKRDALGLGDAHWSLVATLAFGAPAVLMAWGVGAWLAILWLGLRRMMGRPAGQVYFVPFLCTALIIIKLHVLL